jgi:transcriptional regulator with XRE-family HTH domain
MGGMGPLRAGACVVRSKSLYSKQARTGQDVEAMGRDFEQQAFAKRLFDAMRTKGLSQSDLARNIWGDKIDANGNRTAKNRSLVSHYLKGRHLPKRGALDALALALGVTPAELAPGLVEKWNGRGEGGVEIVSTTGDRVWLRIGREVNLDAAQRIITILAE